ncbi:MAG: C39 family peptidase [Bacillota bacterium]|nr:C39 family peptidase [Bacillota bacterium]
MTSIIEQRYFPEICEINDIKAIKQSTYYYCAAACMAMCLGLDLSQDEIYKILNEQTVDQKNWYVEPDAVYSFLSKYGKFKRTSSMNVSSLEATEWILSCMIQQKSSGPMLVTGGKHWVVYAGYQMTPHGNASGIYIMDPWPTTASLSFYAFTPYFFNEYFCKIDVDGNWKNTVESFINANTRKSIEIKVFEKPSGGGSSGVRELAHFTKQIIKEDLSLLGFNNVGFIKHGGGLCNDIIIKSTCGVAKYLLSYINIGQQLKLVAIEVESHCVVAMLDATNLHISLLDKRRIIEQIYNSKGLQILEEQVTFVHDDYYSSSCFDPIVRIAGLGDYNLLLNPIVEKRERRLL